MIGCLLVWLLFVCGLALVWYLAQWVLAKIVDLPAIAFQIFGIILGLVALIQLLGCLEIVQPLWRWPRGMG